MALIKCPNCGNDVSDKAEVCPACSYVLKEPEKIVCSECGTESIKGTLVCPKCGNPLSSEEKPNLQKIELAKVSIPSIKINKKIIIGIVAAIVLVIGIIAIQSSNNEKNYIKNYKSAVDKMLYGGAKAEEVCGDIVDVWSNSIRNVFDPETNKFTLKSDYYSYYKDKSGNATSSQSKYFYDDFNTALNLYFLDDVYTVPAKQIESNVETVNSLMSKLSKVPKGYENSYSAIDALYDNYLNFTELALNPTGSLNSFTSAVNSLDTEFLSNYKKANNIAENFNKK